MVVIQFLIDIKNINFVANHLGFTIIIQICTFSIESHKDHSIELQLFQRNTCRF
jgi:hypothetical protein